MNTLYDLNWINSEIASIQATLFFDNCYGKPTKICNDEDKLANLGMLKKALTKYLEQHGFDFEDDNPTDCHTPKDCPFCGSPANLFIHRNKIPTVVNVRCPNCGAQSNRFERKEDAIKAWNRRGI